VVLNACPRRLVGSLNRRYPTARAVGSWVANAKTRVVWSRMQLELLNRQRWRTRLELANAIVDDLDIVHNRQHRPSSLGRLSQPRRPARSLPENLTVHLHDQPVR
jgi:putative transposase